MEVRWAQTLGEVGLDARQWNNLAAMSNTNSVFQTHQWATSWWATFGYEHEPLLVTVANSRGVVGVAPLVVRRGRSRERVVRFLGDGRADYCDVLGSRQDPEVTLALLQAVLRSHSWDVIELNNLPEASATPGLIRDLCHDRGFPLRTDQQYICPTLLISGLEGFAHSVRNKASLRRRENHFRRQGRLTCSHLRSFAEIEPYLDRFFEQHISRWASTRSPSLFLDGRNRCFYRELAQSLSGESWLLFSVLELNGEPIAFHFGFDYGNSLIWYKPSFNIQKASGSPGLVLVKHLIDFALSNNRCELDFTVGDEPFKRRFTNTTRRTLSVRVYRDSARFVLASSRQLAARVAKRALRWSEQRSGGRPSRAGTSGERTDGD